MSRSGLASVFVVALLGLVVVAGAFVAWTLRSYPADIPGILILYVAPVGLPATLIGASIAASMLSSPPEGGGLRVWLLLGAAVGMALGALGALGWYDPINAWRTTGLARKLAESMSVGAACGMLVGVTVGVWCWQISRPT